MKTVKNLIGVVMLIISIVIFIGKTENYEISRYGEVYEMVIVDKPSKCIGTKTNHFMKVKFNEKIFSKKIRQISSPTYILHWGHQLPLTILMAGISQV